MGYYLSQSDRNLIAPYYHKLATTKDDITISTPKPRYLAYILRNAFNVIPEWKHFKDKFKILTRDDRVVLRVRAIQLEIIENSIDLYNPNIYEILDHLIKKPKLLIIKSSELTESELKRVQLYCDTNNFSLTKNDDNSIRIERKEA